MFLFISRVAVFNLQAFFNRLHVVDIKSLYYYGELESKEAKYNSIDEVKQQYLKGIETSKKLTDMCLYLNKNDDAEIVENSFFNLWCYNEYVKDTFETNKLKHFEQILKDQGFELSTVGEIKAIGKEANKEMKNIVEHDENIFEEYLEASEEERGNVKFSNFNTNIKALGLDGKSNEI